jgi:hypothetical protein
MDSGPPNPCRPGTAASAFDRLFAPEPLPISALLVPAFIGGLCTVAVRACCWLLELLQLPLLAEVTAALFLVDFVSGVFHAALDYSDCGSLLRHLIPTSKEMVHHARKTDRRYEASSAWSQAIWNFQAHHYAPFPEHDDQIVETSLIATPLLLTTWLQYWLQSLGVNLGWLYLTPCQLRVWTMVLVLSYGVQVSHFLAHQRVHHGKQSLPPLVAYLQDLGLMLHPRVHKQHHDTFDFNFCIFNGWANPMVNAGFRVARKIGLVDPTVVLQPEPALAKGKNHVHSVNRK